MRWVWGPGERTRPDPFADVWPRIEEQLTLNPGLLAKTVFTWLQAQYPGRFADGQVRTLQRRIKQWRAVQGPAKEVFFTQVHGMETDMPAVAGIVGGVALAMVARRRPDDWRWPLLVGVALGLGMGGKYTATAPALIGLVFVLLGIGFGESGYGLLKTIPNAVLGSLLLFSGLELALSSKLQEYRDADLFLVLLMAAIGVALNPAAAFADGLPLAYAFKQKWLRI